MSKHEPDSTLVQVVVLNEYAHDDGSDYVVLLRHERRATEEFDVYVDARGKHDVRVGKYRANAQVKARVLLACREHGVDVND